MWVVLIPCKISICNSTKRWKISPVNMSSSLQTGILNPERQWDWSVLTKISVFSSFEIESFIYFWWNTCFGAIAKVICKKICKFPKFLPARVSFLEEITIKQSSKFKTALIYADIFRYMFLKSISIYFLFPLTYRPSWVSGNWDCIHTPTKGEFQKNYNKFD